MTTRLKQFLILPVALVGTFVVAAVAALYVASKFPIWTEPFVGPVSAVAVIVVTFWFAPEKKRLCGMIALLAGTGAAWVLLRNSYYPELHPRAYQPTLIPFWSTVAGGVGAFVLCWFLWRDDAGARKA